MSAASRRLVQAGSRPQDRARGGGSCHTTATLRSSGIVRRDVEQVRRRHSNNYVPAQASTAKLSQRAWVQSHLRLTSMSVRKRKEKQSASHAHLLHLHFRWERAVFFLDRKRTDCPCNSVDHGGCESCLSNTDEKYWPPTRVPHCLDKKE